MIYVSTTYPKKVKTRLEDVLLELKNLEIDGIEIGSTHYYQNKKDFKNIIKKYVKNRKILIHNFFPPIIDTDFVINLASKDKIIHKKSLDMIINNIDFCKSIDAKLYTIHPGFLSTPSPAINFKKNNYDFNFASKASNYNEAFNKMIFSLKKIVNYAKNKKIQVAIETEGSIKKKNFLLMQQPREFKKLFDEISDNLMVNLNLSHMHLASKSYNFSIKNFLNYLKPKIAAIEISSNNGIDDQHLPLKKNCINLEYLKYLNLKKPVILEFRNSNLSQIKKSITILKKINYEN